MDVINVWPHTGKDLKKESECRDRLILIRLTKSNIRDKNKG